jgi:hypothetical protein
VCIATHVPGLKCACHTCYWLQAHFPCAPINHMPRGVSACSCHCHLFLPLPLSLTTAIVNRATTLKAGLVPGCGLFFDPVRSRSIVEGEWQREGCGCHRTCVAIALGYRVYVCRYRSGDCGGWVRPLLPPPPMSAATHQVVAMPSHRLDSHVNESSPCMHSAILH